MTWHKIVFVLLVLFLLSPYGSPPAALALGLLLAFTVGSPFPLLDGKPTRLLLQASVVFLGFGMNLRDVYQAGTQGILFTIVTIFGTLIVGFLIGRLLNVEQKTSSMISAGTAICGGSAIAAVAPTVDAKPEQISISLGTVFILNSIALFIFPIVGHGFQLSEVQFGVWAAIAIHDTSSVVGAAAAYGQHALSVATTVKLARALWIAPVALLFLTLYRQRGEGKQAKISIPWFIFLFLAATAFRSYAPPIVVPSIFDALVNLAKAGMTITLFLIGASLTRETIKAVGFRPLAQGVLLWILISVSGLIAVVFTLK